MKPLPKVGKAYSIIHQEERQRPLDVSSQSSIESTALTANNKTKRLTRPIVQISRILAICMEYKTHNNVATLATTKPQQPGDHLFPTDKSSLSQTAMQIPGLTSEQFNHLSSVLSTSEQSSTANLAGKMLPSCNSVVSTHKILTEVMWKSPNHQCSGVDKKYTNCRL